MIALVALTILSVPRSATAGIDAHALIVTNNKSLTLERPDLHYADDDGIKYAQLFGEQLGPERVVLLTEVDRESAQLYPEWVDIADAPTRANLRAAVRKIGEALERSREAGRHSEIFLVFAGHGDLEGGMGFIELADGRLTAKDLETEIIANLPATRVHLILDSCNSYFMLNPRSPTAKRWQARTPVEQGLLSRYPRVGAMISTTAEAVTYEWSEVQSGIFSYELRSGLRGAADANRDGQITYRELAGFVSVANKDVVNANYRPRVFSRGPDGDADAVIRRRHESRHSLIVPKGKARRLTLRDLNGVRILDTHTEANTGAELLLPDTPGTIEIRESTLVSNKRAVTIRSLDGTAKVVKLDELHTLTPGVASRGESPVFRKLFASPFGPIALAEVPAAEPEQQVFGYSEQDAKRLELSLKLLAENEQGRMRVDSWAMTGTGVWLLSLGIAYTVAPPPNFTNDGWVPWSIGLGSFFTALGSLVVVASPYAETDTQRILKEYLAADRTTPALKARATQDAEREWQELVGHARWEQKFDRWFQTVFGFAFAVGSGVALIYLATNKSKRSTFEKFGPMWATNAAVGLGTGILGVALHLDEQPISPAERVHRLYLGEDAAAETSVDVSVGLGSLTVRW